MSSSDDPATNSEKVAELFKSLATCPPVSPISSYVALVLLGGLIYGTLWGLTGEMALPGGPIFGLFGLVIVCYLGGQLIRLFKLPTLVGMMVFGFILRNVPHINVAKDIPEHWGGNIRNMALILILLRAGLEVDSSILQANKATCAKLIFMPFVAEFAVGGLVARYLLDMPWMWSFLMGAMLSAVSPAVVLPVMLKLQKKGIGTSKGVPTMVIAVAGIDDVVALTSFEVLLGVTFATGSLEWTIAQGPVEVIVGIIYGILLGMIYWYIPNPDEKNKSMFRFLLLVFGGMFVLFGGQAVEWGAMGALGCICLPFVAAIRWKTHHDWDDEENPVAEALAFVWRIIEPFLFGLIGSEIRIDYLQPSTVGLGLATMFIALASRMLMAMLAAYTSGFTLKEQIFVTFAGLPKATVQAAIGPVALGLAKKNKLGAEAEEYGIEILTVAVLAILITAPVGAMLIALLAPRLLEKDAPPFPDSSSSKQPRENDPTVVIPMYDTTKAPSDDNNRNKSSNNYYSSHSSSDHLPDTSEENTRNMSHTSEENTRNNIPNEENNKNNVYSIEKL